VLDLSEASGNPNGDAVHDSAIGDGNIDLEYAVHAIGGQCILPHRHLAITLQMMMTALGGRVPPSAPTFLARMTAVIRCIVHLGLLHLSAHNHLGIVLDIDEGDLDIEWRMNQIQ